MSLEAIIFDVDGTLSETEELHRAAFNRAFGEAGLPWHWDQPLYGRLLQVTGGKERIRHYVDRYSAGSLGSDPAAAIASLHAAKTRHYEALVATGALQLRPGFRQLIETANAQGVRQAIATTTSMPNVAALLSCAFGPRGGTYFEVVCAGDVVPHKKPAPDIYLQALAQLRLPAAACLAIEDSEPGLRAARAAGLATLVVRSDYTRAQRFDGATLVVDSLEALTHQLQVADALAGLRKLLAQATGQPMSAV